MPPDQLFQVIDRQSDNFGDEPFEVATKSGRTRISTIAVAYNPLPEVEAKELNVLLPASGIVNPMTLSGGDVLFHGYAPEVVTVEYGKMPGRRQHHFAGGWISTAWFEQIRPLGSTRTREVPCFESVDLPLLAKNVKGVHELGVLIR